MNSIYIYRTNQNPPQNHPEGMILTYTLIILVLVALMGFVLMSNSSTELSISGNNRIGREAFNTADSTERIATLLSRILVHPELGDPEQTIKTAVGPEFPITIELDGRFTLANLQAESTSFNYLERYLESYNDASKPPHIVFKVNGNEVATAVVNMEIDKPIADGFSIGVGDLYDASGGSGVQVNLAVTVNAVPFNSGSGFDDPRSIITSIYREMM